MIRNPEWTRDELILLLDLYLRRGPTPAVPSDPDVVALSTLLRSSGLHGPAEVQDDFRNPVGICMQLATLLSLDERYSGRGLQGSSILAKQVWEDFSNRSDECHAIAEALRSHLVGADGSLVATDDSFAEGGLLLVVHRRHERSGALVAKKKAQAEQRDGLHCEVCSFDFADKYGQRGLGFMECHHNVPLAALRAAIKTKLSDLALVCANCHRMLHRGATVWTIDQLRLSLRNAG